MRLRVSKGFGWLVPVALYVATLIAGAIAQRVVDDTATAAKVSLNVLGVAIWLTDHWLALLGWTCFGSLAWAVVTTYIEDRKTRPARILERYCVRLCFLRGTALSEKATLSEIKLAEVLLHNYRGELLNLSPWVFTTATAEAFRHPPMLYLGDARKAVIGLPDASERESLLANVDALLRAVQSKWEAYGGSKLPPTP